MAGVQITAALEQLLAIYAVSLVDICTGIRQHPTFAQHGIVDELLAHLYGPSLPYLIELRQARGPRGLQPLDLELFQQHAWSFYLGRAVDKPPLTQVQFSVQHLGSCMCLADHPDEVLGSE